MHQLNWISEIQEPVVPWSKVLIQYWKTKQNLHSSNQTIQSVAILHFSVLSYVPAAGLRTTVTFVSMLASLYFSDLDFN